MEPSKPSKRKVRLMLTCLCDLFYGEVGIAAVKVLEHAGCEVLFDSNQTCCGQPPFNSGDWEAAKTAALHAKSVLFPGDNLPVVTPSGSCAAMLREGYSSLFPGSEHLPAYELGEFLTHELGVTTWGVSAKPGPVRRIAFHRACHNRGIGVTDEQERLVASIPGVEVVQFGQAEQCCGFGGAFSANHGSISGAIGEEKLRNVLETGVEELISGDMGCLMHLSGIIRRKGLPLKTRHYAQVLAEAIS